MFSSLVHSHFLFVDHSITSSLHAIQQDKMFLREIPLPQHLTSFLNGNFAWTMFASHTSAVQQILL